MQAGYQAIWDRWSAGGTSGGARGNFFGEDGRPCTRVTVDIDWYLRTNAEPVLGWDKPPIRWFQDEVNSQVEFELPGIVSVTTERSIDTDAATATITMYNQRLYSEGETLENTTELGRPGYYSYGRAKSAEARARWGQVRNDWQDVLVPNCLLRSYQGFGGHNKTLPQARADQNLVLTGLWLVDEVRITTAGLIELRCRDMAKLLLEQQVYPPLIPAKLYPLLYCFPPGSMVNMADGTYRPIEEVRTGDEVLTRTGVGRVSDTMNRPYDGDVLSIWRQGSTYPIRLTDNHSLWANTGKVNPHRDGRHRYKFLEDPNQWEFVPAGELEAGQWLAMTYADGERDFKLDILGLGEHLRDERGWAVSTLGRSQHGLPVVLHPSMELAVVAGFYLAEGSVVTNGRFLSALRWSFHEEEADLRDRLIVALEKMGAGTPVLFPVPENHVIEVRLTNVALAAALAHLCGVGERNKRLAPEMMMMPRDLQAEMLECYLHGDGHDTAGGFNVAVTASDVLARQIVILGARLHDSIPTVHRHMNSGGPSSRERRTTVNSVIVGCHGAMRGRRRLPDGHVGTRIRRIERSRYTGPVYNLTVEPDHSYAVEDVLVANCKYLQTSVTIGAIPYGESQLGASDASKYTKKRSVYDSSSGDLGGTNTPQSGHYPLDATNTDLATYWLSPGRAASTDFVWYQLDVQEEVKAVLVTPWLGPYTVYVSVMVNGAWEAGEGSIPAPGPDNIAYVTKAGVNFEQAATIELPKIYLAQKVRLTFTALSRNEPTNDYRAGLREISAGTVGQGAVKTITGIDASTNNQGYWTAGSDGGVFTYGDNDFYGSMGGLATNSPVIGIARTALGKGYWLADANGAVYSFGDAVFAGAMTGNLNAPLVEIERHPTGNGYYLVASDGGVFAFGDAVFRGAGSPGTVAMAVAPDGSGYWLVTAAGVVSAFGSATNLGNAPGGVITGMEAAPGGGYYLVAEDGAIYNYGAPHYGDMAGKPLNDKMVDMTVAPDGSGYWLVAADGGIFTFGAVAFHGSAPGEFSETFQREGNYGDFCVDEETEILTKRGWLSWKEVEVGDQTLAINPATGLSEWSAIDHVHTAESVELDMLSLETARHSSLTTLNHRWLVHHDRFGWQWRTSDCLDIQSAVPLSAGPGHCPLDPSYPDDFVELVAWFWTEGSFSDHRCQLAQSQTHNPAHVQRIDALLTRLYGEPGRLRSGASWHRYVRRNTHHGTPRELIVYRLAKEVSDALEAVAPMRVVGPEFLGRLTRPQLDAFIETSIDADGHRRTNSVTLTQGDPERLRAFEIACALSGRAYRSSIYQCATGPVWSLALYRAPLTHPVQRAPGVSPRPEIVAYTGTVWCPSVGHGNWFARRRGTSYFTGNSDVVKDLVLWSGWWLKNAENRAAHTPNVTIEANGSGVQYIRGREVRRFRAGTFVPAVAVSVIALDGSGQQAGAVRTFPPGTFVDLPPLTTRTEPRPVVFGNIESTGTYSKDCLKEDIFDKRPVQDAIIQLREIVGFSSWIDQSGGFRFESPNFWSPGNFYDSGQHTDFIPELDEKVNVTDYAVSYTDSAVRSELIIGSHDPLPPINDTTITTVHVPQSAAILRGMSKPAMWLHKVFVDSSEQAIMAELIGLHIWFSQRLGSVSAVGNPLISINDQVRIYERQTGESYLHYVRGISTTHDLESGAYTMQLTTSWLGDQGSWAIVRPPDAPGGPVTEPGSGGPTTTS